MKWKKNEIPDGFVYTHTNLANSISRPTTLLGYHVWCRFRSLLLWLLLLVLAWFDGRLGRSRNVDIDFIISSSSKSYIQLNHNSKQITVLVALIAYPFHMWTVYLVWISKWLTMKESYFFNKNELSFLLLYSCRHLCKFYDARTSHVSYEDDVCFITIFSLELSFSYKSIKGKREPEMFMHFRL